MICNYFTLKDAKCIEQCVVHFAFLIALVSFVCFVVQIDCIFAWLSGEISVIKPMNKIRHVVTVIQKN